MLWLLSPSAESPGLMPALALCHLTGAGAEGVWILSLLSPAVRCALGRGKYRMKAQSEVPGAGPVPAGALSQVWPLQNPWPPIPTAASPGDSPGQAHGNLRLQGSGLPPLISRMHLFSLLAWEVLGSSPSR